MLNAIYYLRAKTEERHLSLDPVYVQYARWIDAHGIFRWCAAFPCWAGSPRGGPEFSGPPSFKKT